MVAPLYSSVVQVFNTKTETGGYDESEGLVCLVGGKIDAIVNLSTLPILPMLSYLHILMQMFHPNPESLNCEGQTLTT